MQATTSWEEVVKQVAAIEKETNPYFVCSTTANQIFGRLKGIYSQYQSFRFGALSNNQRNIVMAKYLKRDMKTGPPKPQEEQKIYEQYLKESIKNGADVIKLSLAPDHHVVYVKDGDVWILLHSWVQGFGLNFWNFVDHKEEIKYLQLNQASQFAENWRFYSAMICSYMIEHADANVLLPKELDRKKLKETLGQTKTFFLSKDTQIIQIDSLKRNA